MSHVRVEAWLLNSQHLVSIMERSSNIKLKLSFRWCGWRFQFLILQALLDRGYRDYWRDITIWFVTSLNSNFRKQTPDMIDYLKWHSLHSGRNFSSLSFWISGSRPITRYFITSTMRCVICLCPFTITLHSSFLLCCFSSPRVLSSFVKFLFLDQEERELIFVPSDKTKYQLCCKRNDDDLLRHRRWKILLRAVQCTLEEICLVWEWWQNFSGLFNSSGMCIFVTHTPHVSE